MTNKRVKRRILRAAHPHFHPVFYLCTTGSIYCTCTREKKPEWHRIPHNSRASNLMSFFHNSEHFKMVVSTSTPRSRISIATRDFAGYSRNSFVGVLACAEILQNNALLLKSYYEGLKCSPFGNAHYCERSSRVCVWFPACTSYVLPYLPPHEGC